MRSLLTILVGLGPRAAENPQAPRREIRLQRLPRHERDILALGIGPTA
jgi:hypothetical protein